MIHFDRILETGTFRGTSTEFFATVFQTPVHTVESNARYCVDSRQRLATEPGVTVELGDSRTFLERYFDQANVREQTLFVYLDAHWEEDLPLAEELAAIARATTRCIVMIDDFQVPGDSGYAYDDYGPGKALVEDYLPQSLLKGWALMYPTAPSEEETGAKRGCCVLVSPGLLQRAKFSTLRQTRIL